MSAIGTQLRRQVIVRANNLCEYCHLSQIGQEATFHMGHVKPTIAGGQTVSTNLALACVSCSLRKGARESVVDPNTEDLVQLFNPRIDEWDLHFNWIDYFLFGKTPIG